MPIPTRFHNINVPDYIYVRAWERLLGSNKSYADEQLIQARRQGAPVNATYFNAFEGRWHTVNDIISDRTKNDLERMKADILGFGQIKDIDT